jgi:hypothetical protein
VHGTGDGRDDRRAEGKVGTSEDERESDGFGVREGDACVERGRREHDTQRRRGASGDSRLD